ncbi:putative tRNA-binding domain protein [Rhizoctonia solani 123E]|uniref:Putative tRNA-binding domain protein n=1 Tax=Rhizoctonia solani 123E TaxID=1423351 RepID=A0A074S3W9_9AGAM|nr:putative tRNA-binding domain protein [Rhizoctonia solani 123E]
MSTAALEKLSPKAREIVDKTSLGNASSSEGEINKWIERVGGGEFDGENGLSALDTEISSRTYLVANSVSPADLALYATLHPTLSALPTQTHYTRPSLTRYIDHIQNLPALRASSVAPQLIDFKIDEAPKPERKAPPAKEKKPKAEGAPAAGDDKKKAKDDKKKEKGPAPVDPPAAVAPGDASFAEVAAPAGKKEKAPKGEGKKGGEGKKDKPAGEKKPAAAAADSGDPVPSMIDLRVGKIVHVEKHPDADGLYVEQIDLGEPEGPRTVVSGLVNYIPIEQMRDRSLIAVCNLKPASMRGVKSFAMVLCATHKDGKDHGIEIVNPPEGSKPGDRVYFEGEKFAGAQPLSQLNPKKKIFETIQPGFTTLESRECAWVDPVTKSVHRIVSERGACAAPSFVGASLS